MPFRNTTVTPPQSLSAMVADDILAVDGPTLDVDNIPLTHVHLQAVLSARGAGSGTSDDVLAQLNGDTSLAYTWVELNASTFRGSNTSAIQNRGTSTNGMQVATIPAVSSPATEVGVSSILVPDYARTLWQKKLLAESTEQVTGGLEFARHSWGGDWNKTSAVTRLTLVLADGGNFLAGSRLTVYGL